MDINVFLLCFNESALLPHTINHYKKYLPNCKITIYDNESTDNSVEIAKKLGCNVFSFSSNNIFNDQINMELKNSIWKNCNSGWIIVGDMDELLCITEIELMKEMELGTTILQINGYDMIGESETIDLTDIDLQKINKYIINNYESKKLCFLREAIIDINYNPGAHECNPNGNIVYSSHIYINKHMSILGLNFLINKFTKRYERSEKMRRLKGWCIHYTLDIDKIKEIYKNSIDNYNILV
jgi:glycosyltransferase involved in cell wall biosynthesis